MESLFEVSSRGAIEEASRSWYGVLGGCDASSWWGKGRIGIHSLVYGGGDLVDWVDGVISME